MCPLTLAAVGLLGVGGGVIEAGVLGWSWGNLHRLVAVQPSLWALWGGGSSEAPRSRMGSESDREKSS